jgi:hypothetical protein
MLSLAALVSLGGCAARPGTVRPAPRPAPPAATTPVPPMERAETGAQIGTTASGGRITLNETPAPLPAVVDSTPSADALAVLRSIPEPLGGEAAADSTHVPVPAPTRPLGDRPGARPIPALPESLTAPAAPPPAARSPEAAVPADSCWRVQVLAPPERDVAERLAEAARSQLIVPFVIESEGGLYKVRTRDCLPAAAASDLRRRAVESGFAGAFRFPGRRR